MVAIVERSTISGALGRLDQKVDSLLGVRAVERLQGCITCLMLGSAQLGSDFLSGKYSITSMLLMCTVRGSDMLR